MKFKILSLMFILGLFVSIYLGIHIVVPLIFGFILFSIDAFTKGFTIKEWAIMVKNGLEIVKNLIIIFTLIGLLTAGWRLSGTIQYLVYNGANLINPNLFYLFSFILTLIMSMLIGSINGTITTMGIVLISLARANGADLLITTGAILSGGIFGDRMSPVSSAAFLVAELSETDVIENRKYMLRSIILPTIITAVLFLGLSFYKSAQGVDRELLNSLSQVTKLTIECVLPAAAIIVLSALKIKTKPLLLVSIILSVFVAYFVQDFSIGEIGKALLFGVNIENLPDSLNRIVNSGGLRSMLPTIVSVSLSSIYYGIFEQTKFLQPIEDIIDKLEPKIGHYWTYCLVAVFFSMLFCTQAIVVMLITGIYKKRVNNNKVMMLDLANVAIMIPAIIPWNMASNVAFTVYEVSFVGVLFNLLSIITPITYYFYRKSSKNPLTRAS